MSECVCLLSVCGVCECVCVCVVCVCVCKYSDVTAFVKFNILISN